MYRGIACHNTPTVSVGLLRRVVTAGGADGGGSLEHKAGEINEIKKTIKTKSILIRILSRLLIDFYSIFVNVTYKDVFHDISFTKFEYI